MESSSRRRPRPVRSDLAVVLLSLIHASTVVDAAKEYATKSGILPWVDPATPDDYQTYKSSRGDTWTLVMSDEFNTAGRSFESGEDHLFTSIEKPDGVNAALEVYSHNMTSTKCSGDDCYFQIVAMEDNISLSIWNDWINPPGYENVKFYYRGGMVQSWNKFCFQGGMIEVRAQLPGAVSKASGNPDVASGDPSVRTENINYYPTWPGIWMMGNLGRAIFSGSTSRVWPFSYNECNETVFDPQNQKISACDDNPGHGLNPNQGRGAPEIDILEGGGTDISSSIQLGPGMPDSFRQIADSAVYGCMYTYTCTTKGANNQDVPTAYYEAKRGHKSWYQGLRYASNNFCEPESKLAQSYTTIKASLDAGITENACTLSLCPASFDVNSDLGFVDNSTTTSAHWGINTNGTCFPKQNAYTGAFLCSVGHNNSKCEETEGSTDAASEFAYQMDAISSNWPIQVGAYTGWLVYQLEWVTGDSGYVRWMVGGEPLFEIPSDAIVNPPQDKGKTNPKKIMLEEPMYLIVNHALSSTWGAKPPNPGYPCRGNGTDATVNAICDEFPMYLKLDYIRLYQDTSNSSKMAVGCDPASHPTAQYIEDNIDLYTDWDNPWKRVSGKAFCESDDDCTIDSTVRTGSCKSKRCKCSSNTWYGPRCTEAAVADSGGSSDDDTSTSYGPPMYVSATVSGITIAATFASVYFSIMAGRKTDAQIRQKILQQQQVKDASIASAGDAGIKAPNDNYSTNFV